MNFRFMADPMPPLRVEKRGPVKTIRTKDLERAAGYLLGSLDNVRKLKDTDLSLSDGKRNLAECLLDRIEAEKRNKTLKPQHLLALADIIRNRKVVGDKVHAKAYDMGLLIGWWEPLPDADYVAAYKGLKDALKDVGNMPLGIGV